MDNLSTGSIENIIDLMGHSRFRFIKYNVCEYVHIDGQLDAILHFASPASPQDYLNMPIETLKVGSLGTHKMLGLAKAKRARLILASTSEVYGDPLVNPQPESYWGNVNAIGPRGVYDEAKRFSEALTMAYRRHHSLDARIVRLFNTYGPRMRPNDGRLVSNFIVQALSNQQLTVFGDGSQTRSFCYVDDTVRGILSMLYADSIDMPINIGNPEEHCISDMADLILKLADSNSGIESRSLPIDDPKVRRPDIRLAKELLGWEPYIELDDGLRRTIAYFRDTSRTQPTTNEGIAVMRR